MLDKKMLSRVYIYLMIISYLEKVRNGKYLDKKIKDEELLRNIKESLSIEIDLYRELYYAIFNNSLF